MKATASSTTLTTVRFVMGYSQFNGTSSQYKYLHKWVGDKFGRPRYCEHCETENALRYDWAAIDNRYTRKREDWKRLCRSCHQKFDAHLFIGKRFAGKTHKPESKAKTAAALKKYWAEHPEQMKEMALKRLGKKRGPYNVAV